MKYYIYKMEGSSYIRLVGYHNHRFHELYAKLTSVGSKETEWFNSPQIISILKGLDDPQLTPIDIKDFISEHFIELL